jgi:hypothetical protein
MTIGALEQPYGPGALCGDCGHIAARHGEDGCSGVFPERGCQFGDGGTEKRPKKCVAFLWNGVRWYRPWESSGYIQSEGSVT